MAKAIWNEQVLAESDSFETVEGNIYFPPDSINKEYFNDSDTHSTCFWKGTASYFDIEVNGEITGCSFPKTPHSFLYVQLLI